MTVMTRNGRMVSVNVLWEQMSVCRLTGIGCISMSMKGQWKQMSLSLCRSVDWVWLYYVSVKLLEEQKTGIDCIAVSVKVR